MFDGSLVALITPFRKGRIDEQKLAELVEFHVRNGTNGIVPCGTTGEAATLTDAEHDRVVKIVAEAAAKRLPVVAGTGSNDTAAAIKHTRAAKRAGADAALLITPYYNKPTQAGLYAHFRAVAQAVDIPVILYNVPGRTAVNMLPETVARLSEVPGIVGIKEASGSLDQVTAIVKLSRPGFAVLSGDDSLTLPILALGGVGVISVTANVLPATVARLVRAFRGGDLEGARRLHYELFDLTRALFLETNPIPVKTAAGLLGLCGAELRLPLTPMDEGNLGKLRQALQSHNLVLAA
jgi:4-hydroxy-tetrahydrodipicolinate synthase